MQQPKDLFSKQAAGYRQFRPHYPQELYQFLLQQEKGRERAWDCGTGNGQVAAALAPHFADVYATDISENQLNHAHQRSNIHYNCSRAEETHFPGQYFDLITVAQAIHWFDFERFYTEARRVAKDGAMLAVWGYGLLRINREVDAHIDHFYTTTIGPFWDAERRYLDKAYASIPFPLQEVAPVPDFSIQTHWTLPELEGYLSTWSAVQKYRQAKGQDPVSVLISEIRPLWQGGEHKEVQFPIFLRLGKL